MGLPLRIISAVAALGVIITLVRMNGAGSGGADEVGSESVSQQVVDSDKAEMLVRLHEENQRLVGQVSNLAGQVMALEVKLAEARVQADLNLVDEPKKARSAVTRLPAEVVADSSKLQIIEVNREMLVAVMSGGSRAGMKTGMLFSVVRGNEVLAVIKVTEVRERIAGGLIEWNDKRAFPEVGDRLVLRSTQDG